MATCGWRHYRSRQQCCHRSSLPAYGGVVVLVCSRNFHTKMSGSCGSILVSCWSPPRTQQRSCVRGSVHVCACACHWRACVVAMRAGDGGAMGDAASQGKLNATRYLCTLSYNMCEMPAATWLYINMLLLAYGMRETPVLVLVGHTQRYMNSTPVANPCAIRVLCCFWASFPSTRSKAYCVLSSQIHTHTPSCIQKQGCARVREYVFFVVYV